MEELLCRLWEPLEADKQGVYFYFAANQQAKIIKHRDLELFQWQIHQAAPETIQLTFTQEEGSKTFTILQLDQQRLFWEVCNSVQYIPFILIKA